MVRTRSSRSLTGVLRARSLSEPDVHRLRSASKRVMATPPSADVVVAVDTDEPRTKRRRRRQQAKVDVAPSSSSSSSASSSLGASSSLVSPSSSGHRVAYIHVGEGGEADLEAQLKGADNLDIQILEEESLPDIDASDMIHGLDHTGTARDYVDERHVCTHSCPVGCQGHLRPNEIVIYESYKFQGKLRGRRRYKGRIIYSGSSSSSDSSSSSGVGSLSSSSLSSVSVSMATTERPRRGIPRSLALLNQSTAPHPYRRVSRGEQRGHPVILRGDAAAITRQVNPSVATSSTINVVAAATTARLPSTRGNSRRSNAATAAGHEATPKVIRVEEDTNSINPYNTIKNPTLDVANSKLHSRGCLDKVSSLSFTGTKASWRLQQLLHTPPPPRSERVHHAWDNENKSHNIFVKPDDPFTFHRHPVAQSTDCIRTRSFYETGIHAFEIQWPTRQRGTHAVVGVGTREAPTRSEGYLSLVGNDEFSWGWDLGRKKAYHDSKNSSGSVYPTSADETFQVPATFLVVLDMDAGTLGFVVDDHYLGHAFEGLRGKKVHIMVSAVWGHCEITLNYLGALQPQAMPLSHLCRRVIRESTSVHSGCHLNGYIGSCQYSDECIQKLHLPNVMHSFLQYKDTRSQLGYLRAQERKKIEENKTDGHLNKTSV